MKKTNGSFNNFIAAFILENLEKLTREGWGEKRVFSELSFFEGNCLEK